MELERTGKIPARPALWRSHFEPLPGFTIIAILVMALGIGATASLFTIVNAVLLKPLPFRDPGRLVMVYEHFRASTSNSAGFNYNWVSAADFNEWRQHSHSFQDMAAWRYTGFSLTGNRGELPESVAASAGSWNLFSVLGVPMALGRAFTPQEDRIGATHVVILTWSLYQRRFHGDPSILGQQIHMDTIPYTVVGVLPRWFTYPDPRTQLWVPYASTFTPEIYGHHDFHQSLVIARLRPVPWPPLQSSPSARSNTRCIWQISTRRSRKTP